MDYELSTIIKKEKENIFEDDGFLKPSLNIGIKVETGPDIDDWCTQKILSDNHEATVYPKLEKEDSQTCVVCYKYFPDSYSLYKHNLIHIKVPLIKSKFFMCNACPKVYLKKKYLENHIIMEHQPKKQCKRVKKFLMCPFCNKTYLHKTWFEHMRTVHGGGEWKCEDCDAVFNCERYLKRHVKVRHDTLEKTWDCPKCTSTFNYKSSLTAHLSNIHNIYKFQCNICKSYFKRQLFLRIHMKQVHNNVSMVHSCYICGEIFQLLRNVRLHIINIHGSKGFKRNYFY